MLLNGWRHSNKAKTQGKRKSNSIRSRHTNALYGRRRGCLQLESLEERMLLTSQPDLIVQAFSVGSPSAVLGNSAELPVTWTIKNQGTFAPRQNWSDTFYLSSKTTFDSTAVFVGSVFRNDALPLPINGTYTATTTLKIPNAELLGNQNLLVVTDSNNSAQESNTSNNSAAAALTLSLPNVTLAVSNLSISTHQLTAGNGSQVSVTWTVTNNGSDPALSSWYDQVVLSNKTFVDSSAVFLNSFSAPQTLAPGASYTQTQLITIPNTTMLGSNLNLLVQADAYENQGQTSTINGTGVISDVTVATPGNIDLQTVAGSLTAPSNATLGQTIPVTWTVKNIGTGTASASWQDGIYSSPTATFDGATAHFLGSVTAPSALAAGASYTQTLNVSLPGAATGDSFLFVRSNVYNSQAETSTGNNLISHAIALSVPSLAITAFTGPAAANLGNAVTLNWTVKNTSAVATAIGWSDSLYLSDSPTYDPATAQFVQSFNAPVAGSLAAGASYNQAALVTIPYSQIGNRFLILVANATSATNSFQGNQPVSGTTPIQTSSAIALGQPDLTVALNSPPTAATLGQAFNLSWTVTNTGSVAATNSWADAVFISSSATFDAKTAALVGTFNAPTSLAAGASYTNGQIVNLPSMPAGTYHLFVVVDRANDQGQANESVDNIVSTSIVVAGPALSLTINSAPVSVVSGNGVRVPVTWTVSNTSSVDAVAAWNDTIYLSSTPILNLSNASSYRQLGSFGQPYNPNGFQVQGYLNAGASYTNTQQVPIPNLPAGNYFLIVVANSNYFFSPTGGNGQSVTSSTGATASAAVALTLPDVKLVVQSATPTPATVQAGSTITLSWIVQNQGTETSGSTWSDQVYISSKQTFDSTAIPIGSYFNSSSIAPNGTYSASATATIPGDIAGGTQYLLIRPNESQGQAATSTVFAQAITVTIPDVKLSASITDAPASIGLGDAITITYKVTNVGSAGTNAAYWYDYLYLSTRPTYDDSARYLNSYFTSVSGGQLPLAVNGSFTTTSTFNFSQSLYGLIPGNYYLILKVNQSDDQAQTDASQSVTSVPITVTASSASNIDLIITGATGPASATLGSSISLSYTVKYQGTTPTQIPWADLVYVSNSPTLNNYDSYLTQVDSPSALAGGASYTKNLTVALPSNLSTGTHYLVFQTNAYGSANFNNLNEINLGNNTFAIPITLNAPRLAPTALTVTGNTVEGSAVTVAWTVQNQGTVSASGNWQDSLFISDSPTYDPDTAIPISSFSEGSHSPLTPQSSYSESRSVILPATTVGSRYLLLVTNSNSFGGVGGNANRTDFVFAVPITLTAPNLAVSDFTFSPSTAAVGNQATLGMSWKVTNTSDIATNQNWTDAIYLSATPFFIKSTAIQLTSVPNKQALAAGGSYSTSLTNVVVPTMQPGTYYLFLVANSNYALMNQFSAAQPESGADDNILAASNPLALTAPGVNLQVSSPQIASTTVVAGQTVQATFQVSNSGAEAALSTWADAIYISSSAIFSPGTATLISNFLPGQSPLAAGANYSQSTALKIPDSLSAGTYFLFYVTNYQHINSPNSGQGESIYSDDVSAPLQITVNVPDLSIAVDSAPAAAKLNDTISVSYTVTNISSQYAAYANWTDAIYLSSTATYEPSSSNRIQVAQEYIQNFPDPLATGGSYSRTLTFTVPKFAIGQQYLLVMTDFYEDQGQVARANDVIAIPINLSAPQVNLQIVPGSASVTPAATRAGTSVSVSWSVQNAGSETGNGPWYDNIYISSKNTFDSSAQSLYILQSPPPGNLPLAANGTYSQSNDFVFIPSSLEPGSYYLYVVTNDSKQQSETNANDNVSVAIPLTVDPPPAPDLQVMTASATPTSAILGSSLSVSWTVKNTGEATGAGSWEDAVFISSSPTFDANAQLLGVFSQNRNLAAGTGEYSDTQTVSLANLAKTITGTGYILVQTDFSRSLTESDFSNNTTATSALTFSAPSFGVTEFTAPETGVIGGSISISWKVTNTSSVDAQVTWNDLVYISPNNTLDGNARFVGSFPAKAILAAGASYTQTQTVTLPMTFTGAEFLIVVADHNNSQPQVGTANIAIRTIDVSGVDLIVTAANAPGSSVGLGQTATVSWTVKNDGAGAANQDWSDSIYISSKNTLDASAILLKTVDAGTESPLAAAASYSHTSQVTIPSTLAGGSYFILIQTNGSLSQLETSSSNNILASSAFTVLGANLTVGSATAPASANFGQSIAVNWTVNNTGNDAATQLWGDGIYLSSKNTFDNTAIFLKRVPVGNNAPLATGGSYTQSTQVTLPLSAQSVNGTYFLFVVANDQSSQAELNFGDNWSLPQSISLTLPPLPDLVVPVGSITAPSNAFNNQQVLVSWVDKNNGTAAATGPWVDKVFYSTSSDGSNPVLLGTFSYPNSLSIGASAQLSAQVTLPALTGTIWIVIQTDTDQGANEGINNQNNISVSPNPINVTQQPLPDVVVTDIVPPLSGVLSGTTVPIQFTITNQGTAPTSVPTWNDYVFMSQDPNLTYTPSTVPEPFTDQVINNATALHSPEIPILKIPNPSYLNAGESYQTTVNYPIPIYAQGTWYVYVVTNGLGSHLGMPKMVELTRDNNLALSPGLTVNLAPFPILATTVSAPAQNFSGQPATISWTVTNTGTGTTAATVWDDAIYLSTTPSIDANSILIGGATHAGSLQAGGSYSVTATVQLPVGVSGQYYFLVQADVRRAVFQNGNTSTNLGATDTARTINLTPPPDLTAAVTGVPASAQASHAMTFTYTVTNTGASATPNAGWVDSFFLSPTATYNPDTAVPLGQQNQYGGLASGASYINSFTATVPNGLSGSYFLIVNTDAASAVFEVDKVDNIAGSLAAIQITSKPAKLTTTAGAPTTGAAGASIPVSWTVKNDGTGDTVATSWYDNIYIQTNNTLDGNKTFLGRFLHTGLLNPGESYSQLQTVKLPIDLPIDVTTAYHIFVVTNQPQAVQNPPPVFQTDATGNVSGPVAITISQNLADLQIASVTGPATATGGANVNVSWTVNNVGSGATNINYWYDDVWLSTNQTIGSGGIDVYLGTVQHSNLLAEGASYTASGTFTLPTNLAAGSYFFVVATDRPINPPPNFLNSGIDLVFESNEINNQRASTPASTFSSAATPQLAVSAVVAPDTATSGGQLTVSWTVTNQGTPTGIAIIKDSVYLSLNQVLNNAARYLGTVSHGGALANGASYTQNATLQLPAGLAGSYYVFVVSNSDNAIFQQDRSASTGYDAIPVSIVIPPPADLVAGTLTVPVNAIAGENVTISYQVTNNGTSAATGSWYDSLYLSSTPTFNAGAVLLGTGFQQQTLAANGGVYTGTISATLPGIAPGSYYVILRTNILNNLPESTQANNLSASLTQTAVDANALTLGVAANGSLATGKAAYYKVVVPAGQTLKFAFTTPVSASYNNLYVSFGAMPSPAQFDFASKLALSANQTITVPNTQAGAYYVLAYAQSVPAETETYALTASLVPFAVSAIAPSHVDNSGLSTIEIDGARFDRSTTFQLIDANNVIHQAESLYFQDASTVFATFDLSGKAIGSYTIQATAGDGTTTTKLTGGLTLSAPATTPYVAGSGAVLNGALLTYIDAPPLTLPDRLGTFTITYANVSGHDITPPLLVITSPDNTQLGLTSDAVFDPFLQVFAASDSGPGGILRPGQSVTRTFYYRSGAMGGSSNSVQLGVVQTDSTTPIDIEALLPPATLAASNEAAIFAKLTETVGNTYGSFVAAIARGANLLPPALGDNTSRLTLLDVSVDLATAAVGTSISGRILAPDPAVSLAGQILYANNQTTGDLFIAYVLNDGSFVFPVVTPGTYSYEFESGLLVAPPTTIVLAGQAVHDVTLNAVAGAALSGLVGSAQSTLPIAGATVRLKGNAGSYFQTVSDGQGKYHFSSLPADIYTLIVDAAGYARTFAGNLAINTSNMLQSFNLANEGAIAGAVAPAPGGPPFTGLLVRAQPVGTNTLDQTYTISATSTAFSLGGLPAGTYSLTLILDGYLPTVVANVVVSAGGTANVGSVSLPLASTVSGTVSSNDPAQPALNLAIGLFDGATLLNTVAADALGNFTFTNVGPGSYRVGLVTQGFIETDATVSVVSGSSITGANILVQVGGVIAGIATDSTTGNPLVHVKVFIVDSTGDQSLAVTDDAGKYRFRYVAAGTYTVFLPLNGANASKTVTVSALDGTVVSADLANAFVSQISGTIRDSAGQALAIAGILLIQDGKVVDSEIADANGNYLFYIQTPGIFSLQASATAGSFAVVDNVTVSPGVAVSQNFVAGTGSLQVTVIDVVQAVTGDVIQLYLQQTDSLILAGNATLAADGIVTFANLTAGTYVVQVQGSSDRGATATVTITSGQAVSSTVTIAAQVALAGVVQDGANTPIAGAIVQLLSTTDSSVQFSATTDAAGSYSLHNIPPGTYDVVVSADHFTPDIQTGINLAAANTRNVTLAANTTTITGRIVDTAGLPLANAYVTITDAANHFLGTRATSIDGRFTFTSALGASLGIQVGAHGYTQALVANISAPADQAINVGDIVLNPVSLADPAPPFSPQQATLQYMQWLVDVAQLVTNALSEKVIFPQVSDVPPIPECVNGLEGLRQAAINAINAREQQAKQIESVGQELLAEVARFYGIYSLEFLQISGVLAAAAVTFVEVQAGALFGLSIAGANSLVGFLGVASGAAGIYNSTISSLNGINGSNGLSQLTQGTVNFGSTANGFFSVLSGLALELNQIRLGFPSLALIVNPLTAQIAGTLGALLAVINNPFGNTQVEGTILDNKETQFKAELMYYRKLVTKALNAYDAYTKALSNAQHDPNCDPDPEEPKDKDRDGGFRRWYTHFFQDPNNIIGPAGFGDQNYINLNQTLNYRINFENEPTATAPAPEVIITQHLDPGLNSQSFRLGSFGWGGQIFQVPAGSAFYQTTIHQDGFDVQVAATIDVTTNIATWIFTSVDPNTGQIPLDPTVGFLPPNDANGIGEGFVSYTIFADQSGTTGTVIKAKATIVFTTAAPIETPEIFNTIDAGTGLTSSVDTLPAFTPQTSFLVSWSGSGSDLGSAVSSFTIFVSENGGVFTPWLTDTDLTQATYTGVAGHNYAFYSIAKDNAGNVEGVPASPEASTTINLAPGFTSPASVSFLIGTSGTFTLGVSGAPTPTVTLTGTLPNGIQFLNGVLSGSAAAGTAGNYTLTFTADNGFGVDATQTFTLTIGQAAAITNVASKSFALGTLNTFAFTATGFPNPTFTHTGDLPAGVNFLNGVLSGTPAAGTEGTYSLTIIAHNGVAADAVQTFTLNVVQAGAITGTVFRDFDLNTQKSANEPAQVGQTLYLDLNNNNQPDAGEPSTISGADGSFSFAGVVPGTYSLRQVLLGGFILSTPVAGSYNLTVTGGSNQSGNNFGNVLTSITIPLPLPPSDPFPSHGSDNANYVEALYRSVLGRNSDAGGLAAWTSDLDNARLTRLQVVQGIRNSPEHFGQEIDAFYQTLLLRNSDADGRAYWVGQLQAGVREEQIAFDFLNSPEYLSKGDKFFVDAMYQSLLGRAFDPVGEAYWLNALGNDNTGNPTHPPTTTHEQVITDFLFSEESLSRLVEGYYEVFLQRQADPGGLASWVAQLQGGLPFLSIGQEFVASDEFYNKAKANN